MDTEYSCLAGAEEIEKPAATGIRLRDVQFSSLLARRNALGRAMSCPSEGQTSGRQKGKRKSSHSRNHSCPPDIGVEGGHPNPSKTIPPSHTLICPSSESNTTDTCTADTSDDYVTLTQAHPIQNTSGSSDYTYAHQQTQGDIHTGVPSMSGLEAISCGHSVDQEEVRYVSDPVGRYQEIKPNSDALSCSTGAWVTGLGEDHTLYSDSGDSDDIDTASAGHISLSDSSPENIAMLSLGLFHSKHIKSSIGNENPPAKAEGNPAESDVTNDIQQTTSRYCPVPDDPYVNQEAVMENITVCEDDAQSATTPSSTPPGQYQPSLDNSTDTGQYQSTLDNPTGSGQYQLTLDNPTDSGQYQLTLDNPKDTGQYQLTLDNPKDTGQYQVTLDNPTEYQAIPHEVSVTSPTSVDALEHSGGTADEAMHFLGSFATQGSYSASELLEDTTGVGVHLHLYDSGMTEECHDSEPTSPSDEEMHEDTEKKAGAFLASLLTGNKQVPPFVDEPGCATVPQETSANAVSRLSKESLTEGSEEDEQGLNGHSLYPTTFAAFIPEVNSAPSLPEEEEKQEDQFDHYRDIIPVVTEEHPSHDTNSHGTGLEEEEIATLASSIGETGDTSLPDHQEVSDLSEDTIMKELNLQSTDEKLEQILPDSPDNMPIIPDQSLHFTTPEDIWNREISIDQSDPDPVKEQETPYTTPDRIPFSPFEPGTESGTEDIELQPVGGYHSSSSSGIWPSSHEDTFSDSLSTLSSTASPSSTPVAEFPSDFSQWTFKDREEYVANMRKTSNTTNPVRERASVSSLLEGE